MDRGKAKGFSCFESTMVGSVDFFGGGRWFEKSVVVRVVIGLDISDVDCVEPSIDRSFFVSGSLSSISKVKS